MNTSLNQNEKYVAHYVMYKYDFFLEESIESVYPFVDKILIARTLKPWNGKKSDLTETDEILQKVRRKYKDKVEVFENSFEDEHTQRNYLIDISKYRGHQGAFIVDCDEIFIGDSFNKIYNFIKINHPKALQIPYLTFIKDASFVIAPPYETNLFYIDLQSGVNFISARQTNTEPLQMPYSEPEILHFSYLREKDQDILDKVNSFMHCFDTDWDKWYEEVYTKFNPKLENFHPVWPERWRAIQEFNQANFPEKLLNKLIKHKKLFYNTHIKGKQSIKLHLGCGSKIMDGYINIDLYNDAADVKMNIADLKYFEDNTVDEIFMNAVFEHIYTFEQYNSLSEWFRVLKPQGTLRIDSIPDFDEVIKAYINKKPGNTKELFDLYEVSRYTHGEYKEFDRFGQIHKDIFTVDKVRQLLESVGFNIDHIESSCWEDEPNPVNINVRASKPANISNQGSTQDSKNSVHNRLFSFPATEGKTFLHNKSILCSIIIPVYNQWNFTEKCLNAIYGNTPQVNFEIIIVNNASTDQTGKELSRYGENLKIINNEENAGFTIACNQGASIAQGKYLVFLNNDTTPLKNWLDELVELAESDDSIGAVGSKLIYPDGTLQEAGGVIFSDGSGFNFGRGDNPEKDIYNHIAEVDYCTGASLLVRSDLFIRFGMFDERYAPAYSEDSDLCFTLRENGYKVLYNPKSIVVHYESITSGKDNNSGLKRYLEINRSKFVEKWKDRLIDQDNSSHANSKPPLSVDRNRLLNDLFENRFLYRKKYLFRGLDGQSENLLEYFPSFNFKSTDEAPINKFTNPELLLTLVKSYGLPWLFGRAYLEGRHLIINQNQQIANLDTELINDIKEIKKNYEPLKALVPSLLNNILDLETKTEPFLSSYLLKLAENTFSGSNALKVCYRLVTKFAILNGILDESSGLSEETGIKEIEKIVEKYYLQNKRLPEFSEDGDPLVRKFYRNEKSSDNKSDRLKVLCFFPHNPYPPRTGADHGFMGMLNALQELDCDINLLSSTYFSDKPWKINEIEKFSNDKNINIYIHQANEEDHIFVSMMQLAGGDKKWDMKIPENFRKAFLEVYKETLPDIVLINYAWWGKVIDKLELPGCVKILQMHDLLSLNTKMQAAAVSLIGSSPFNPENFHKNAFDENIFNKFDLKADSDEYEIYNRYDYVIAVSEKEADGINQNTTNTSTIVIPAPIGSNKLVTGNTYENYPLFAIANNVFNIQAYYYFVKKVLPIIKKEISGFQINVVGDGCRVLQKTGNVNLLGFVDDINALYQESCFAIAPMLGGTGQSVKILEAMANGLPVVSLRNVFQTSSIIHNVNGFEASNAVEFANYVIKLYKNRELCRNLGEAARNYIAKNFSQEKLIDSMKPVLENVSNLKSAREENNIKPTLKKSETFTEALSLNVEEIISPFVEKTNDKFIYLKDSMLINEDGRIAFDTIDKFLDSLPAFYSHFGGAGDACIFLSTFYDDEPEQVVLSFANSREMMECFFEPFDRLKKVYLFNSPKQFEVHQALRFMLYRKNNCKGMGITPLYDYMIEWNNNVDIIKNYGVNVNPDWIKQFSGEKLEEIQIVLHPAGSSKGMVGSKKNKLNLNQWQKLLSFWNDRGVKPIIIGTPEDETDYPVNTNCHNKRSYNFRQQMEIIASSDLFIGADSWGKSFSALCNIPTIVFPSLKGSDLNDWKDPSEYIFIEPWKDIYLVENNFEATFNKVRKERFYNHPISGLVSLKDKNILWEGPQFVNHSLALVNRELCYQADREGLNLSIANTEADQFKPSKKNKYYNLLKKVNLKFDKVDITIRHQWPPNLNQPQEGHWVIIQPWEYGILPAEWVSVFSSQVDEMWVPSEYVRNLYINSGVPEEHVFVVPNGVDTELFNPSAGHYKLKTNKKFKFLFVGGTIYRKGIDLLLDAYTKNFTAKDDVCLVIKDMGRESFYKNQTFTESIKAIIEDRDSPEIEYIDRFLTESELAALYNTCDVLVHPYRGEGFGLPILEAMACGTPAIVTDGGSCKDFCNSKNSLLVSANKLFFDQKKIDKWETPDYPWVYEVEQDILVEKMKFALNNPDKMKQLGKNASDYIREYWTWENSFTKMKQRIEALATKPVKREKISDFEKYFQFAISNLNKNNFEQAIIELEKSVALFDEEQPSNNIAYHDLLILTGNTALILNNYEKSKEYFEKALELNPESSAACAGLAETFYAGEEFAAAKTMFEWAIYNDPDNAKVASRLKGINLELGYDAEHNSLFQKEVDENNAESLLKLAYEYFESKKFREALEKLDRAEKLFNGHLSKPDNKEFAASFFNLKGFNLLGLNQLEESKKLFEKALELLPDSSKACAGIGEVFYLKGMDKESKIMYEWAVKNNPHDEFAVNGLGKVNQILGFDPVHNSLLQNQ